MAKKGIRAEDDASDAINIEAVIAGAPEDRDAPLVPEGTDVPEPAQASPFAPVALAEPVWDNTAETPPPTEEPQPDPGPSAVPVVPAKTGSAAGRFAGLVAGGLIAAGLGFGLATYGVQQGWPLVTPPTAAPEVSAGDLAALKTEVARLSSELAAAQRPVDLGPLDTRITALENRPVSEGPADLGPLIQRLNAVEAGIANGPGVDEASVRAQIDALVSQRMQAVEAEAQSLKDEALTAAAGAADRSAVFAVQGAFNSGAGLSEAIAAAKERGVAVPVVLDEYAAAPVGLTALQAGFPDAARAALAAARAAEQGQGPATSRLTTFLMQQTGARLTEPREGTDPDAVLSRMEAAIQAGDINAARAMEGELPAPAIEALSGWSGQADTWIAARDAVAALTPAQ